MNEREIYIIRFDPQYGTEIKKPRPAVIVSDSDMFSQLTTRIVVPIRDFKPHHAHSSLLVVLDKNGTNNLKKKSTVDCIQVKSVDIGRIEKKIGEVTEKEFNEIKNAIALCLNL